MTDSRHRKVDRKQGVKVRSKQGRRRSSGVDQPLSREELKVAAQADRARRARRRIAWAVGGALVIVWSAVIFSFWLGQRTTTDDPQTPIGEVPSEGVSALFAVLIVGCGGGRHDRTRDTPVEFARISLPRPSSLGVHHH